MSFDVDADAYGRFMGRYSVPLAGEFANLLGIRSGQRALDVGCGTGALTSVLVDRLGFDSVSAIDPSMPFVAAVRDRFPGLDVHIGGAEALPWADDSFDLALAQLVVMFMTDAVAGIREMSRVTRPGGLVAASIWDHRGGRGPLSAFYRGVLAIEPDADVETALAGSQTGRLGELLETAGLAGIEETLLTVRSRFGSFEEWWEPYTLGVGPAGDYVAGLDLPGRERLRAECARLFPAGEFEVEASAWVAVGRVP